MSPIGVATSCVASVACIDIDPCTEKARWIGEGPAPDPFVPVRPCPATERFDCPDCDPPPEADDDEADCSEGAFEMDGTGETSRDDDSE